MRRIFNRTGDHTSRDLLLLPERARAGSNWKPTLRRIKQRLFSSKNKTHGTVIRQGSNSEMPNTLDEATRQHLDEQPREPKAKEYPATPRSQSEMPHQTALSPDNVIGVRAPPPPKGFNLIKKSLSKSKKQQSTETSEAFEAPPSPQTERPSTVIRPRSFAYAAVHSSPGLLAGTRSKNRMSTPVAARPKSVYISTTVAARPKSAYISRPVAARPKSAYIPTHAASDFSQMFKSGDTYGDSDVCKFRRNSHQPYEATKIRPTTFAPDEGFTDYQDFLAQTRKREARTNRAQNALVEKSRTPQASHVMDDITTKHHENERIRRMSLPTNRRTS